MLHVVSTALFLLGTLYLSVTFERVLGVPVVSFLLVTVVLATAHRWVKFGYFVFALLVLSTFYGISPLTVGLFLFFTQVILFLLHPYFKKTGVVVLYTSLVGALLVAVTSGLVWTTQILLLTVSQFFTAQYLVRALVFKEEQASIQWKKELFSGKVLEKTI